MIREWGKYLHLPFKSSPKFVNDLNYFENGQFENQNFGVLVTSEWARVPDSHCERNATKKQQAKQKIGMFLPWTYFEWIVTMPDFD